MSRLLPVLTSMALLCGSSNAYGRCLIEEIAKHLQDEKKLAPSAKASDWVDKIRIRCDNRFELTSCTLAGVVKKMHDGVAIANIKRECMK